MEGTKINLSLKDDCKTYRISSDLQAVLVAADVDIFVMENPEKKGGKYLFSVECSGKVLFEKITLAELKKIVVNKTGISCETLMPEKTQYQLDYEKFEMPNKGVYHTTSDYEESVKLCKEHIQFLMKSTERNALKIGVILNIIQRRHIRSVCGEIVLFDDKYKTLNNIYEYAAYYFEISRGSCNQFMNIAKRFTKNAINIITGEVELLPEFSGFSVSQLIQMLPYEDDLLKRDIKSGCLLPTDSVRSLREKLKVLYVSQAALVDSDSSEPEQIKGQLSFEEGYEDAESFDEAVNVKAETDELETVVENVSENKPIKEYSVFTSMAEYDDCISVVKNLLEQGFIVTLSALKKCSNV